MILTTERLRLRLPRLEDAPFIQQLLNDPDWLRNIGDRGVRNEVDAARYVDERLLDSFRRLGMGLWLVESRDGAKPLGLCGLLKREHLDDVDLGFAFLPAARGHGYALEAARRSLQFATQDLGLQRVLGLVLPTNTASIRVLIRLGMVFERQLTGHGDVVDMYASQPASAATSPA